MFRPESSVQNTHVRPRKYGMLKLRINQVHYKEYSVPILYDLIQRNDLKACAWLTLTKYGYFCAIGELMQTGTQIYRLPANDL